MGNGAKLIINMLLLIAFIGGATYLTLNTVEISDYTIRSIADYGAGIEEIQKAQASYDDTVQKEKAAKSELQSKIKKFDTEKESYETITPETIATIADATKIEKYSLEYLWVRIGMYASKYNLKVLLREPGNTYTGAITGEATDANKTADGSTTTDSTKANDEAVPGATTNKKYEGLDTDGATTSKNNQSTDTSKVADNTFKIEVTGAYKDICNFIYVIENDSTLRFKLENIDIAGSDAVKATFDINDMQVVM